MGCGTPWIWRGTPRIVHLLRKTTSHATSPPLRFGSVTGCRPYTAPCNLASAPLRLGHGLSPYKKAKKQIFLRERAPDKICFYLFCMACSFREKSACIMEKGMVGFSVERMSRGRDQQIRPETLTASHCTVTYFLPRSR